MVLPPKVPRKVKQARLWWPVQVPVQQPVAEGTTAKNAREFTRKLHNLSNFRCASETRVNRKLYSLVQCSQWKYTYHWAWFPEVDQMAIKRMTRKEIVTAMRVQELKLGKDARWLVWISNSLKWAFLAENKVIRVDPCNVWTTTKLAKPHLSRLLRRKPVKGQNLRLIRVVAARLAKILAQDQNIRMAWQNVELLEILYDRRRHLVKQQVYSPHFLKKSLDWETWFLYWTVTTHLDKFTSKNIESFWNKIYWQHTCIKHSIIFFSCFLYIYLNMNQMHLVKMSRIQNR